MRPLSTTAGDRADRAAIDRAVVHTAWSTIRPVSLGLAPLYALYTVFHLFLLPDDIKGTMALVAGATAVVLLGLALFVGRADGLEHLAFPISFGIVALAWLNSWLHLALTDDILQTTNLILVVIGASVFIPAAWWFGGVAALVVGSWGITVASMGDPEDFVHFAFAMVSAVVVGGLFQWVRTRTLREAQRLRLIADAQRGEMELLATRDALTGVPNRRLLIERLELAIADAKRTGERVGLLFFDLDDFKGINDTFGHTFGDEALTVVATELAGAVRETDLAARVGGDEFAVLLTHLNTAVDLDVATERIGAAFSSIEFPGKEVTIEASIGAAIYPDDADTLDGILDAADAEMYRVKREKLGA